MFGISVIIPAYNRAELIVETLRSLLNQTMPAKEIIVVDDGSTDGTAEKTLEAFENWKLETGNLKKVSREPLSGNLKSNIQNLTLKILRQSNAGPAAARNRGLAEATGEFIHFFDSDDIAAPNKQEVQLRALLETGADIAYGPWVKGRFEPVKAQTVACGELSVASFNSGNTRYQLPATLYSGFIPEGPVLQARGLPDGDLVKALLTNWSVVPHACLFRRSIVQKIGGFPEELFGTEDQLMFLRCLLAGARVVHTPETFELYRVGESGKITAIGAAQRRHAKEWARFLLKAQEEVTSGEWRVASKRTCLTTECTENTSPTRSASGPDSLPATSYSLPGSHQPSAWFGFRLRAYEAWRDLEKFFPHGEDELKSELKRIWSRNSFSVFGFRFSGFLRRKLEGLKLRVLGYREQPSFYCQKPDEFARRLGNLL
jgi:GT2 family glycosyltransferase